MVEEEVRGCSRGRRGRRPWGVMAGLRGGLRSSGYIFLMERLKRADGGGTTLSDV